MKITAAAAGKINLLLDLTGVLDNGYHCIYTVMQSISVFDKITIEKTSDGKITLECDKDFIPTDTKNTAYKSAQAFFNVSKIKNPGIKIFINKNIPCQAGMGGGSADAAAVLVILNEMFSSPFTTDELCSIGETIGADVPFCIKGGCALCLNIGEVMAKLPSAELYAVVVKPEQNVSTKTAYENFDSLKEVRHPDNNRFLYAAVHSDYHDMCRYGANVFEQAVEVYDRADIKSIMRSNGAGLSMMTGSGSAVFGIFNDELKAKKCFEILKEKYKEVHFSKFIEKSIFIE